MFFRKGVNVFNGVQVEDVKMAVSGTMSALESAFVMTDEEANKAQEWRGMDGAIAHHLIERHANNWHEIGVMMRAWLRANSVTGKDNHG